MSYSRTLKSARMIQCSVGKTAYFVDTSGIRGIQRSEGFSLDDSGNGPDGWLTGRRTRVPIFFMAGRLGQPNIAVDRPGAILIIDGKPDLWGLAVDRASQVIEVEGDSVLRIPPAVGEAALGIFQGVVRLADNLALFVSPERLHPDFPAGSSVPTMPTGSPPRTTSENGTLEAAVRHQRLIAFTLTNEQVTSEQLIFGLSITQVSEMLEPQPLLRVPNSSPSMLGLVRWRDRVVPVVDLGALIGLPATRYEACERLIVCRAPDTGEFFAILASNNVWGEGVPARSRVAMHPEPLDPTVLNSVFDLSSDNLLLLPNLDAMFGFVNALNPVAEAGTAGLGEPDLQPQ